MRISQIVLIEGYKEAKSEFASASSPDEAISFIERFKELVKSNKAKGDERNIDYWRKQGWEKFKEFVTSAEQTVSSKSLKKQAKEVGKAIILKETDKWLIVIPLDKSSSCFYGKDTAWCTTKPFANYYEQYFYERSVTLIYFLNKESGGKWAIAFHNDLDRYEYFDQEDNSISQEEFDSETGLNSNKVVEYAASKEEQVQQARAKFRVEADELRNLLKKKDIGPHVEKKLIYIKNLRYILEYLRYALEDGKVGDVLLKLVAQLTRDAIYAEMPEIPSSYDQTELFEIDGYPDELKSSIISQVVSRLETQFPDSLSTWRSLAGRYYSPIGGYIKAELENRSEDSDYVDLLTSARSSSFFKKLKKKIPTDVLENLLDDNLKTHNEDSEKIVRGIINYAAAHPTEISVENIKKLYKFSYSYGTLGRDNTAFAEIVESGDRDISKEFLKILKFADDNGDWHTTTKKLLLSLLNSAPEDIAFKAFSDLSDKIVGLLYHNSIIVSDIPEKLLRSSSLVVFLSSTGDPVESLIKLIPIIGEYITPEVANKVLENSGETIDEIIAGTRSSAGKMFISPLVKLLRPDDKKAIPDYASLIRAHDRDTINDYREILKQTNNDPNIIAALTEVGIVPGNINYNEDLISKIIDNSKSTITVAVLSTAHARLMDTKQVQSKLKELNANTGDIEKMVAYINKIKHPDAVTEIKRLAGL